MENDNEVNDCQRRDEIGPLPLTFYVVHARREKSLLIALRRLTIEACFLELCHEPFNSISSILDTTC